jgi:hypothetical protein
MGAGLKIIGLKISKIHVLSAVIFALTFSQLIATVQAQNVTAFTTSDGFEISQLNGSIRFAYNGTYTSATLQNNTWVFRDLSLNNSNVLGNLTISVQDSDITIFTFYSYRQSAQFNRYGYIRYNAQGIGTQTINLNINVTGPTDSSEWGVVNPAGVFLAEGRDWNLLSDNTVIVHGRTGNVTVAHYGFALDSESNEPFYIQHSVALVTFIVLVITAVIAVILSFKLRSKPLNGN